MRVAELFTFYVLVGLGVAVAASLRARSVAWVDAGLLLLFWPLYGPFVLTARAPGLGGSATSSLARTEEIERRMRGLSDRVADIDRLLAQPDFRLEDAEALRGEHEARGDQGAARRVGARISSIRALTATRARLVGGLAEARELLAQLRVQAEVMRVTGGSGDDTRALLDELASRVEGLDAMMGDEAGADLAGLPALAASE